MIHRISLCFLLCTMALVSAGKVLHGHLLTVPKIPSGSNGISGKQGHEIYKIIGDMFFTKKSWQALNVTTKGLIKGNASRWPKDKDGNVIVPYVVDSSYGGGTEVLLEAMAQWSSKTCVKFYEKNQLPVELSDFGANWVIIQNGDGCSSFVGKIGGGQPLHLGAGCYLASIAAHEIGHALGLFHQQERSDRDDYVILFPGNMYSGSEDQFFKEDTENFKVPYNYLSIMHYSWNAFAVDQERPTLLPKDPSLKYLLTDYNPVGHYDALAINRAYGCEDTWRGLCGANAPPCFNDGYLGPSCTCVCPEGTTGVSCGVKTASNLPAYPSYDCGGKITTPGDYSVPGMGEARDTRLEYCVWFVEAPTCKTAQVEISAFNLNSENACSTDSLRVGSENVYDPEQGPFCGGADVIPDGTKFTGSPSLALHFRSLATFDAGATGFNFQVDFLDDPLCVQTTFKDTCTLTKVNEKTYIWTSPGFPGKAPPNSRCSLVSNTKLSGFEVMFDYFKVTSDTKCKNSYVTFSPTFPPTRLCNNMSGKKFKIWDKRATMDYKSNPKYYSTGFNITITAF